jgi:hypothetical protein
LDDLSVHHQELKTTYTATVYVKQLLLPAAVGDEMERCICSFELLMMDRKTVQDM